MRGMSAMGMNRCYSSSSDSNKNKKTDQDYDKNKNIIGKNRSNSISDDKVRSINKDKISTSNNSIGNIMNDQGSNRKMNSQDKRYHNHKCYQ
jgi:hypothetical protein